MDRSELYTLNDLKIKELTTRLKPITNWDYLKKATLIWHDNSNSIYGCDMFEGLNPTDENIIVYRNKEGKQYARSKTGWYYYDECIVDEVNEYWTPKLWEVYDHREDYQSDRWLFVACNEEHLLRCWNQEQRDNLNYDEFTERYNLNCISEVNNFSIKVE